MKITLSRPRGSSFARSDQETLHLAVHHRPGPATVQRCPSCRKRYWPKDGRLRRCPKCHGPLEEGLERRQEFHSGFKTKREAELELAKVSGAIASGTHIEVSRLLVDDFLREKWLPAILPTIRQTTYLSYVGHIECHISPNLGRIPLQQLSPADINAFYAKLLTEPRPSRALPENRRRGRRA